MEHGTGKATVGSNGKPYVSGWGGNGAVSTAKIAKIGKAAGIVASTVSTLVDVNKWADGDPGMSSAHLLTNLGFTALGFSGPGAILAVPYSLIDGNYPGGSPAFGRMLITPDAQVTQNPSLFLK